MLVYKSLDFEIKEKTIVTIGKFDGLHLGHRELIREVLKKKKDGEKSLVFRLKSEYKQRGNVLLTDDEVHDFLLKMGVDILVEVPMDRTFLSLEAQDFLYRILLTKCHMAGIVCGSDFRFGKEKKGNTEYLIKTGEREGFSVNVLEKKDLHHQEISSTMIRNLILDGKLSEAKEALGYGFFIRGKVIHGRHLATEMGFPTANIQPLEEKILPPFGVYAVNVKIDGKTLKGMANLGIKPTVTEEHVTLLETYIFGINEDLYDKDLCIEMVCFMRPEKKFPSIIDLKDQLLKDCEDVRNWFDSEKN